MLNTAQHPRGWNKVTTMTGTASKGYRTITIAAIWALLVTSLMVASPLAEGAGTDPALVSGSRLDRGDGGELRGFSIWIEFPSRMDPATADKEISLYVPGHDEWSLSDPDFPYSHNWSEDGRTLSIDSGSKDLGDGTYSLTVTIDTCITDAEGASLFSDDRSEVVLAFGDPNMMRLDFGFMDVLLFFVSPFIILVVLIMLVEVALRLTIRPREKDKVRSSAETMLRLIDRSERMLRNRLIVTLTLTFLVASAYFAVVLVALINSLFAMVMTWALLLFVSPWAVMAVTSILYAFYRWEHLRWKANLERTRHQQGAFLNGKE